MGGEGHDFSTEVSEFYSSNLGADKAKVPCPALISRPRVHRLPVALAAGPWHACFFLFRLCCALA